MRLKFGRWVEQAPYLPQCEAIALMPHAARLGALAPPLQHAAVELLRGTMARHSPAVDRSRATFGQPLRINL